MIPMPPENPWPDWLLILRNSRFVSKLPCFQPPFGKSRVPGNADPAGFYQGAFPIASDVSPKDCREKVASAALSLARILQDALKTDQNILGWKASILTGIDLQIHETPISFYVAARLIVAYKRPTSSDAKA